MSVTQFVRRKYKFRTRLRTVEGLIGSHIPGTRAKLVNQAEIFERLVGALENVSITKRARPLCCRWKVEAVWLCTGHFVVSVYVPLAVAFYDSFLFIVEPESLVHNGPVRGMRAGSRCLSRLFRPSPTSSLCVFFFFSFYHEETGRPSRNEKRTRAEMKNRRGGAPSL